MYGYYEQCMVPYGHLINLCKEREKEGRKRGREERKGEERVRRGNGFSIEFYYARLCHQY